MELYGHGLLKLMRPRRELTYRVTRLPKVPEVLSFLVEQADIVVRYAGGNNAGHTVYVGKQKYVLHLVPSGILRKNKLCVIGNGVVVDPLGLVSEIEGHLRVAEETIARMVEGARAAFAAQHTMFVPEAREIGAVAAQRGDEIA